MRLGFYCEKNWGLPRGARRGLRGDAVAKLHRLRGELDPREEMGVGVRWAQVTGRLAPFR